MTTESWQPSRNFFNQNAQSAEIRDVCLDIFPVLEKILKIKSRVPFSPYLYRNDLLNLYSQLEMADGALLELGIAPNMHEHIVPEEADQITLAQWVAGQILPYLGTLIDSTDADDVETLLDFAYFFLDADIPEGF